MSTRRVEDMMVKDVRTVRSDADVHELSKLLLKEKIHGVPVVDPEGRLVGVVSQTDLLGWHFGRASTGRPFTRSRTSGLPADFASPTSGRPRSGKSCLPSCTASAPTSR